MAGDLHQLLGCQGYFGFGTGYDLQRRIVHGQPPMAGTGGYCNTCPVKVECWQDHRTRVREAFPDLTQLADQIAETHRGADYFTEWQKQTDQAGDRFVEPYMALMTGNMEDGGRVQQGLGPKDRGRSSLTWPLQPRRRM